MKFAVKTSHPELSEAVQKVAFKYGYKWNSNTPLKVQNTNAPYLVFNAHEGDNQVIYMCSDLEWPHQHFKRGKLDVIYDDSYSFDGIVKALQEPVNIWKVGCRTVEIVNGKLMAEDTEIPFETVKEIYNVLKKARE